MEVGVWGVTLDDEKAVDGVWRATLAEKGPKKFSRFMRHFPTTTNVFYRWSKIEGGKHVIMMIYTKMVSFLLQRDSTETNSQVSNVIFLNIPKTQK